MLASVATVYLAGVVAVARRRRRRWPAWRTACFLTGLGVCLLAVSSVIGVYDMALFSVHMLGHLMLVMVAPTVLVAGRWSSPCTPSATPGTSGSSGSCGVRQ